MQCVVLSQDPPVFADLALRRRHESDAAMAVLMVVPVDEACTHCRSMARSAKPSARYGAPEVERFLSALTTEHNVAAFTQNQAFSAILFL